MRLQEIMGIEANRKWGVCSLNEFRKVCEFPLSTVIATCLTQFSSSSQFLGLKRKHTLSSSEARLEI
jgi:hypothetical protein